MFTNVYNKVISNSYMVHTAYHIKRLRVNGSMLLNALKQNKYDLYIQWYLSILNSINNSSVLARYSLYVILLTFSLNVVTYTLNMCRIYFPVFQQ